MNEKAPIHCPKCQSDALNRYGKTANGKKRYLCLVCGRQFITNPVRKTPQERPPCPKCGKPMHCYKREPDLIRFRCSDYPNCRTYVKLSTV
jgi:DNA-directed RNA polymerase subunit RPC12/RpoP